MGIIEDAGSEPSAPIYFTELTCITEVFQLIFPKLHQCYQKTLGMASALVHDCSPPSKAAPFATYTLNVGDRCVCGAHVDGMNLACGLCMVIPFGTFDFRKGGHLILHELKLVIEVPPGGTVLFPSAIITHENIPIAEGELRQSITAFTPGTLFQWVNNGFRQVGSMPGRKRRSHKRTCKIPRVIKGRPESSVWDTMRKRLPHITSFL